MNLLAALIILFGSIFLFVFLSSYWDEIKEEFSASGELPPVKDKAKLKLSKIDLPEIKFQDSGWVLLYVIFGWICFIVGILVLFIGLTSDHKDSSSEAAIFFCSALLASLSCFFAAHVLRLQEKTAHHAEKNSELLKSINEKLKD